VCPDDDEIDIPDAERAGVTESRQPPQRSSNSHFVIWASLVGELVIWL